MGEGGAEELVGYVAAVIVCLLSRSTEIGWLERREAGWLGGHRCCIVWYDEMDQDLSLDM